VSEIICFDRNDSASMEDIGPAPVIRLLFCERQRRVIQPGELGSNCRHDTPRNLADSSNSFDMIRPCENKADWQECQRGNELLPVATEDGFLLYQL